MITALMIIYTGCTAIFSLAWFDGAIKRKHHGETVLWAVVFVYSFTELLEYLPQ